MEGRDTDLWISYDNDTKKGNLMFTITVETNWESKSDTLHQADRC